MRAIIPVQDPSQTAIQNSQPSLATLVEKFVAAEDVAQSSKRTYRRQLTRFIRWLEESGRASSSNSLQREDVLCYKADLVREGLSVYSVNGYLTALRKLFAWLESEKIYPNIASSVKGLKKPRGYRKDTLTPGQLRDALEAIDRSTLEGLRDYALFNLMARTGLRDIEAARATVGNIRREAGQAILWIQGKGRDLADDFVLLVEEAERPLRRYLQARASIFGPLQDGDPLFCSLSNRNKGQPLTARSVSRIVKGRLTEVGLDNDRLTAHSLRHTAITLSIAGGASLQQAQAMARHSDPKTTLVYFHNQARIQAGAERCIQF